MDADSLLIDKFVENIVEVYEYMYGKDYPADYKLGRKKEVLSHCAKMAGELISARADTPYHDLAHAVDVTLTMQEILLGKHTVEKVDPEDWFNCVMGGIYHDIGYIPDLFTDDSKPIGITGASLTRDHVKRSMRHVRERFEGSDIVDGKKIASLIEYTSVPVIKKEDTESYGGLLRAADYIGQLANIDIRKRNLSLLHEFAETGFAKERGFKSVDDVIADVPNFFYTQVEQLVEPAMRYLERTKTGLEKVRSLYGVIKLCETFRDQLGKDKK